MKIDLDLALRAGGMQTAMVVALALVMRIAFPSDFFETYGWLTGPAAWLGCAALVAIRFTLPKFLTVIGAAMAGVPMLIALAIGAHWLGVLLGVAVFAAWCGAQTPARPRHPEIRRRRPIA